MLTLILTYTNVLEASAPELAGSWITLIVDIICSVILLIKAIKNKKVTFKDFLNLFGSAKGRQHVSTEIGRIIDAIEKETEKADEAEAKKEQELTDENAAAKELKE